jgi:hypothetical protein
MFSSFVLFVYCVGSSLCNKLIIISEEYCWLCVCMCVVCLIVCDLETSSKRRSRRDVGYCTTEKILLFIVGVLFNYEDDGVSNGAGILAAILQILTPAPIVISVQWCRCTTKQKRRVLI